MELTIMRKWKGHRKIAFFINLKTRFKNGWTLILYYIIILGFYIYICFVYVFVVVVQIK